MYFNIKVYKSSRLELVNNDIKFLWHPVQYHDSIWCTLILSCIDDDLSVFRVNIGQNIVRGVCWYQSTNTFVSRTFDIGYDVQCIVLWYWVAMILILKWLQSWVQYSIQYTYFARALQKGGNQYCILNVIHVMSMETLCLQILVL